MKVLAISIFYSLVFTYSFWEKKCYRHIQFWLMPFVSALLFSHLVLNVDFAIQQQVKKTVYIGDYHLKSNVHAGEEKHLLRLLLKSTILTSKETADTKTDINRNFTAKAYSAYTLTGSSGSTRMSLTTELQWFQTLSFCNVSPSWQCNTPTRDWRPGPKTSCST